MSLENISELGKYAQNLEGFSNLQSYLKSGGELENFNIIRDSLKDLDIKTASRQLQDLKLNPELSKQVLIAAKNTNLLKGSVSEITEGIENFQYSSSIVDDLSSTFTGLESSVKSGLSSMVSFATANPYIAALIGIGAALTTAIAISGQFIETYDEANEKAKESAKAYEETQNTIHSLNSELQTSKERLEELQKLQDSGSITATEKEELELLKNKNVELERELKIQEKIAEMQRQEANTDAINALNKTDASVASMYDDKGNKYHKGTKMYDANVSSKTDAEALEASTQKIDAFKNEIEVLQEKQLHTKTQREFDKIQKDIDRYNAAIKDLETDMITRSQNISDHLQNVSDKTSKVYEDNSDALDKYLNEDLSKTENQIVSMKESLDGSTTLIFEANLDGVQTSIERVTTPNGIVSFQADVNGVKQNLEQVVNADGSVSYKIKTQEPPKDKEAGLWYKIKGVLGNIKDFFSGGSHLNGTAHANGTLNTKNTLNNNWKTSKSETALTGELGQELVVHGNRWWTVGDHGAEFSHIPKDSVVFNAKQTKELLSKGHTNSRGRARLHGTAFVNGTSDSLETFNWIEAALSRIQRTVTNFGKTVAATWQSWSTRNAALKNQMSAVRNEISLQDQAYNKYMALANSVGLSEGYKALVRDGAIDISTIESESIAEAIKQYQEYYEKALAAKDASADLKDELAALSQTKFDNLTQSFADLMSGNEHAISMYEATIDLMEKRGYIASASLYDSLKEAETKNQDILKEKYHALSQALDEAVSSGTVVKYSEQWYQMQNEILAVEEAILDSNNALAEFDNSLRELEWNAFDELHEQISEIHEETEFLAKLLSDEKKFNENGSITEYGQAALGLHAVNYKTYLAQAEEYAQELERIRQELANDPYNQTLLDREDELLEKQRETIQSAEDEKQAMIDIASEGYDTLLDYMDKLIDKRKDMLSQAKNLYEYEKNISEQTKEITSLEKQLAAYEGDDSEEARATIQKLQVSLAEAKDNLEETEYDKYISDQEELLETLRLQTEEWINARLDNEDQLLKDIVSSTEKNATMIKDTLTQVASSTGTTLSEAMKSIWSNEGDIGKAITEIKSYLANMQKNSDEKAKEQTANNTPTTSNSGTTTATAPTTSTPASTNASAWGDFFIKKADSYPKEKLNTETSIVDRLKYNDYDSSFSARSQYYTAMGGSGIYTGSSSQNSWMIAQMKSHSGFARGGFIGDMIRAAGEDGIALVRRGEGIIPTNMVPEWNALIHHLPQLNHSVFGSIPQHETNVSIDIGDIQMYGVNDPEAFAQQLKQAMLNNNSIRNIIKDTTIGEAIGRNSMIRYTR